RVGGDGGGGFINFYLDEPAVVIGGLQNGEIALKDFFAEGSLAGEEREIASFAREHHAFELLDRYLGHAEQVDLLDHHLRVLADHEDHIHFIGLGDGFDLVRDLGEE